MPITPIMLPTQVLNPIATPELPEAPSIEPVSGVGEKPTPEVILVAGVGFPSKKEKLNDEFNAYCNAMTTKLKSNYKEVCITTFIFYDAKLSKERNKKNSIKTKKIFYKDSKLKKAEELNLNFESIIGENYRDVVKNELGEEEYHHRDKNSQLNDGIRYFPGIKNLAGEKSVKKSDYITAFRTNKLTEKSLSIGDVYSYIESLGDKAKGSLVEFHVFSHSWEDGPVLANTDELYEDIGDNEVWINDGKYLDKDARIKDFDLDITVIKDLSKFKDAFAPTAFSTIWGCYHDQAITQLILQTIYSKQYKKKDMIKNPTQPILELQYNKYWGITLEEFHSLLKDSLDEKTIKKETSEKKSLENIKGILRPLLENSYMKNLAKASGKDVLGALPGSYAAMGKGSNLMHIPLGPPRDSKESDYRGILKFYKEHFNITFKPESKYHETYGRGYGIYKP